MVVTGKNDQYVVIPNPDISEGEPIDLRTQLKNKLQYDPLYHVLERHGWQDQVLESDLVAELNLERHYFISKTVPEMLNVKRTTLYTWFDKLNMYINVRDEDNLGKYLDWYGVVRAFIVKILREEYKPLWMAETVNAYYIKNPQNEEKGGGEIDPNALEDVHEKITQLEQQNFVMTKEALMQGDVKLLEEEAKSHSKLTLLEKALDTLKDDNKKYSEDIDKRLEETSTNIIEVQNKKLEEILKDQQKEFLAELKKRDEIIDDLKLPFYKKIFRKPKGTQ
jgi:hypothetical protein